MAAAIPTTVIVLPSGRRATRAKLVRIGLRLKGDPRPVVADSDAPYFGARLEATTLLPSSDARLGDVHFRDWAPTNAH